MEELKDFLTTSIIWDYANNRIVEAVRSNQGDSNGRILRVKIINGDKVVNTSNMTLHLAWKHEKNETKGLDGFVSVDASKGIYEMHYTTGLLSNAGKIDASLVAVSPTIRVESVPFIINNDRSLVDDDSVQSMDSFTSLTDALTTVSAWLGEDNEGTFEERVTVIVDDRLDEIQLESGADGLSAYEVWLSLGNTGNEQDFINSLRGTDGNDGVDGDDGNDGLSAYEIWLNKGNTGSEEDFIDYLKASEDDGKWHHMWLNGFDFGMNPDYNDTTVDNGPALQAMFQYIMDDPTFESGIFGGNRRSKYNIEIPRGIYRIKTGDIGEVFNGFRLGNIIVHGNDSVLMFEDFEGNAFTFNDALMRVEFHNIEFRSLDDGLVRDCFALESHGGTQELRWHSCYWFGRWRNGYKLTGTDSNCEYVWNDCYINGLYSNAFLFCPADGGSDQSLNYWFNNCKFWANSRWVLMEKGGHIKLDHCDVSTYDPVETTYLFELGNLYGESGFGVHTFIDNGSRYELWSDGAKVIKSKWGQAQVIFRGSDFSSSTHMDRNREATFYIESYWNANLRSFYLFDTCKMLGRFHLKSRNVQNTEVCLRSCTWWNSAGSEVFPTVDDFFTFEKEVDRIAIRVILERNRYRGNTITKTLDNKVLANMDYARVVKKRNTGTRANRADQWNYPIEHETWITKAMIHGRYSAHWDIHRVGIRSDVSEIVAISTPRILEVASTEYFQRGEKIATKTDVSKLYTVLEVRQHDGTILIDSDFTGSVNDIFAKVLCDLTDFRPRDGAKVEINNTLTKVINPLYTVYYGTGSNDWNLPLEIFIETME